MDFSMKSILKALSSFLILALAFTTQSYAQEARPADNPSGRLLHEIEVTASPYTGKIPENIRARELEFSKSIPIKDHGYLLKNAGTNEIAAQNWVYRGPRNIGGRCRALGIDVANENNIIAGGVSGGMWRSVDGGTSWVRTSPLDQTQSVSCLAQDVRSGKTQNWYYGTGEFFGNSTSLGGDTYFGEGIFKSTDNGVTWSQLQSTVLTSPIEFDMFKYVWRIAVDHTTMDQDIVYAATIGGIHRSTDGGETWNIVLGEGSRLSAATDIAISPTGVIYATLSTLSVNASTGGGGNGDAIIHGIYRSTDGIAWTDITPDDFPDDYNRIVLDIADSDENILYFLAETPGVGFESVDPQGNTEWHSFYKYTYLSGDGSGDGGTWENRSNNLPRLQNLGTFSSQGSYDLIVRVKPDDPDMVFIGGTNIYRSNNGFASQAGAAWIGGYNRDYVPNSPNILQWQDLAYPNHHPDIHEILFSPSNPNVMFTGSDGGVHKTTVPTSTNVSWQSLNNGFQTTQFYAIDINEQNAGDYRIIGGMQDNSTYISPEPGTDWEWLAGGDGGYCAIPNSTDEYYYVTSQFGRVYRSLVDDRYRVDDIERISVNNVDRYEFPFIAPIALDPNSDENMYIIAYRKLYRNNGLSFDQSGGFWQPMDNTNQGGASLISSVAVSKTPADVLYFGTSRNKLYKLENGSTSTANPVDISGSNFPFRGRIACIALDPESSQNIMAVFSNYDIPSLFYTSDGGATWMDVSGNLEEQPDGRGAGPSCRWADMVNVNGQTIWFVGTSTGLYSTTQLNGQETVWMREGPFTIGNAVVSMVKTRDADDFVAVATHGNGVFTATAQPVGFRDMPQQIAVFTLDQNYPNPASTATEIHYVLPEAAEIDLAVFNTLGRRVATIAEGTHAFGQYFDTFDVSDLPTGQYFIRLQAGEEVQTRLMTVVR